LQRSLGFTQMAIDVFSSVQRRSLGLGLRYKRVDLDALVAAVRTNRHMGGLVKITRVQMQVEGESHTRVVLLGGPDVAHSQTYSSVIASLAGEDLEVRTRRCRLLYDDHQGKRFALESDRYGNLWFHVSRAARNLSHSHSVFKYRCGNGLIEDTFAFPPLRGTELDDIR
jgi:hypothetical protein